MIVIFTARNDLHALAVYDRIMKVGSRKCVIVECDRVAQGNNISYRVGGGAKFDRVRAHNGELISLSDASLIWLRRIRANQVLDYPLDDDEGFEIVNNDCRGALSGLLQCEFNGKWFSHPEASFRASDKIYQLAVAEKCGFAVPKTLVSQSYEDISNFFDECSGRVIVKTVVGVNEPFLQTKRLNDPAEFSAEAYAASPAIYQEYVEGETHLRILSFGGRSLCGLIRTTDLDWRPNLNVDISAWKIPDREQSLINRVLDALGLTMGVIDIKVTSRGEYVWLEVNPQGQFLFLEPLTGIGFIQEISDFFIQESTSQH